MAVVRVGVQSPAGGAGQVVDLDGPSATIASVTNASGESVQYSIDGGTSWVTLASAAVSASLGTVLAGRLRMRKVASGAYPAPVDVDATINGLEDGGLTAAQVAATQALVLSLGTEAIQRPWRIATFGDSRAGATTVNTLLSITGSTTGMNDQRSAMWLAGGLGDAEIVANYAVSGDAAVSWAASARSNSKTINNLIAANLFKGGPVDAAYVQFGINDYVAGTSAATVTDAMKALCSALMGAGLKVIFEATNPASAASYGASSAAKLQATIDGNAIMSAWLAGYPRQAVFVDTFNQLVDATGFASATYTPDGTHFNRLGAMLSGTACAVAARRLFPLKSGLSYSSGSLAQPNLIDWVGPTQHTSADVGTVTFSTPSWNIDAVSGMPYAECTMTCTVLSGGYARGRWEVHATTISGGSPRYPIFVGDELQGSAYVTVDNGSGEVAPIQCLMFRHRLFSDSKYADSGATIAAAGTTMTQAIAHRLTTPTFVTATASAGISAPANGAGYPLQALVEFNTVGQVARVRMYAPSLRVVSSLQPTQPAAGASPYTYTNITGAPLMLYVAGGTVSAITLARQGSALTTGFTAGMFYLAQGDALTITYTVAPTLTVQLIDRL